MHYMRDTNDQDALEEKYWPDEFKRVIRKELRNALSKEMPSRSLSRFYRRHYSKTYRDVRHFVDEIIYILVISAENGADDGFDGVYNAFLNETRLPEPRRYARSYMPQDMTRAVENRIRKAVVESYRNDDDFIYAYNDGYTADYNSYEDFLKSVARLVVAGVAAGFEDKLEQLYRSFLIGRPLVTIRRNPKRLKVFLQNQEK
jgi:hypothetical protein